MPKPLPKSQQQALLKQQQLNELFPFFFIFDKNLRITAVGGSLKKLLPALTNKLRLNEFFSIKNPRIELTFDQILEHHNAQHSWQLNNNITLRGQLLPVYNQQCLLFVGSPWFQEAQQLADSNLTFSDFAHHDSTLENLFIKQAQSTHMRDNEEMVTSLERSVAELQKLEALQEELAFELNIAYDLKIRFTPNGIIIDAKNSAAETGFINRQQLVGKNIHRALPFLSTALTKAISSHSNLADPVALGFEIKHAGQHRFFEARLALTPSNVYLLLASDVTKEHHLKLQLEKRANYDLLTGLPNRSYFFDRVKKTCASQMPSDCSFAMMIIDLDRFKSINDSYGHAAGDVTLKVVAETLNQQTRKGDVIARLGGDEFGIYAYNASGRQEIIAMAKRICDALDKPIHFEGNVFRPGCSIGLAFSEHQSATLDTLQVQADLAMYEAKTSGRGTVVVYQQGMHEKYQHNQSLREALSIAIDSDRLSVAYQPVVINETGEVVGVEALARWTHPKEGTVGPDVFIPIAEESGFMVKLGRSIMRKALSSWATVCQQLPPAKNWTIALNVSCYQLYDESLQEDLARTLRENNLRAEQVVLEITESALIRDFNEAARLLTALKKTGFKIALDDFGTGFSSLSYLDQLCFDILKIDRSFTAKLGTTQKQSSMVEAIIRLADSLQLDIIAEGVETPEQQQILTTMKCCYAQGFLFSKPLQESRLLNTLTELAHG